MHTETIVNPETYEESVIEASIRMAAKTVAELDFDTDFLTFINSGREPIRRENPMEYWSAVSNFTSTYEQNHPELSKFDKQSFAVIAKLPLALIQAERLDDPSLLLGGSDRKRAKRTLSAFNDQLRSYFTTHPTSVEAAEHSLKEAAILSFDDMAPDKMAFADRKISETVRRIQHELGFEAMLDHLGVPYRPGTIDEDLAGADVILRLGGHNIKLDVKASLSEVDVKNNGSDGTPYSVNDTGDITMFSLLDRTAFKGKFLPTKASIESTAPILGGYLMRAVGEAIAKK